MSSITTQPTAPVTPPGKPALWRRTWFRITAGVVIVLVAFIVMGSATNHPNAVAPKAAPTHSAPAPQITQPVPTPPAPATTAPAAPANTGPLATMFTVTTDDSSTYTVAVGSVAPASLAQYGELSHYGDHMVAAQVVIFGKTGQVSDDANSDLTVIGSDGQVYQPSFNDTTAGTNFDSGEFRVGPGQMVRGVVNFELPAGVTVKSLQWAPGLGNATATWNVG